MKNSRLRLSEPIRPGGRVGQGGGAFFLAFTAGPTSNRETKPESEEDIAMLQNEISQIAERLRGLRQITDTTPEEMAQVTDTAVE